MNQTTHHNTQCVTTQGYRLIPQSLVSHEYIATHTPPTLYELASGGGGSEGMGDAPADSGLLRILGPVELSSQLRAMHHHPAAPQINHPY